MAASSRLRMRTKLAFGLGSAAEQAVYVTFNTFNFLFYNNVLGLSGTLCGLAVTIALVIDALGDPVIGSMSDRFRSRFGRRHPFMYAAALPVAIAFYCIYAPPAGLSGWGLFAWFTCFAVLQRQALSVFQVPHLALGAELSDDYRERSVVMSYNTIFSVVGGGAAFFFGWTWFAGIEGGSAARDGYPGLAAGVALFAALAIVASAFYTRDQVPRLAQAQAGSARLTLPELLREMRDCAGNRNYRMLLCGLLLFSASLGTRETLHAYMTLFYWELPENQIRVFALGTPPAFVLAFLATARLHARFDKRRTLACAVALTVVAAALPVPLRMLGWFPDNGSPALLPTLVAFVFLFYLGIATMTISLLSALADVADEHELHTGRRQEGVFYAARTFGAKLTSALGHVLAGAAVDLIAFPTGAAPGQVSAAVLLKLGLIDGPLASLPALAAVFFYARYGIDRHRHAQIQRALRSRRANTQAPARAPVERAAGTQPSRDPLPS